ncbi:MAG: DNA invertase Pin-like site-specific DNA recombinase [Candidatus Paceibacteria bacterium]|jgi:DNA invertase Pin-like site-specific DNA recombinase
MKSEQSHLIMPDHLAREAIVYIRQSSAEQVRTNVESTRLQRDMREKAIALGWRHPVVIDDDLGISAGGYSERPGFKDLLTRVATQQVGIILCVDASRLSRNSKDWAHLFELCSLFHTLIADVDQIYDLARPNDRLVMGIKGTVSEMELGLIRQRMRSGSDAKAARGELRYQLVVGYKYDTEDQVVFDPDKRTRQAIEIMFSQFTRCTSIRQLAMWYRDTETLFPSQSCRRNGITRWEIPTSNILRKLLIHPSYAGVYVFGRRKTVVEYVDGRLIKRVTAPRPPEEARVCIHDHHPGYISWESFLENRAKIAENRPRWKMRENRGAIRDGLALLVGLLRCAECGGRIRVSYKKASALYYCDGGQEKGSRRCMSFGSNSIDARVGKELCRAMEPHSIRAAVRAVELSDAEREQELEISRLQVEAAQYQADRAFEQFDLCDPKNRHVADTLEERLNDKLAELHSARDRHEVVASVDVLLSEEARAQLEVLARDFPTVWDHPRADAKLKKRLLRAAVQEILVKPIEEKPQLEVIIHWQGGVHTQFHVKRPVRTSGKPHASLEELVKLLAAQLLDAEIARILNMKKMTTPRGLPWTVDRVKNFRNQRHITGPKGKDRSGTMTMNQVQQYLGIGHNGLLALVRRGAITTNQITDFAPWQVSRKEVDSEEVQRLVKGLKENGRLPKGGSPQTQTGLFDETKGLTSILNKGAL